MPLVTLQQSTDGLQRLIFGNNGLPIVFQKARLSHVQNDGNDVQNGAFFILTEVEHLKCIFDI